MTWGEGCHKQQCESISGAIKGSAFIKVSPEDSSWGQRVKELLTSFPLIMNCALPVALLMVQNVFTKYFCNLTKGTH